MKANTRLLDVLTDRVIETWEQLPSDWPYHADPETGEWTTIADGDWCSGHWIDALRIAARRRSRPEILQDAVERTRRLVPWREMDDMFRAPMFYYSAARLAAAEAVPGMHELALDVAGRMLSMAIPVNGAMKVGTQVRVASTVPLGDNVVAIDNVHPNVLLHWYALATTDDRRFEHAARRHLDTVARDFIRPDGSTVEFLEYDPDTGTPVRHFTLLGDNDESCWSRGQAWGIAGYLRAYEELADTKYLDTARTMLDYWMRNAADGTIPAWDFAVADPSDDEPLDTSASAIVVEAMARLHARDDRGDADDVVALLPRFLADLERHVTERGALVDGCFNNVKGFAERHELVWGDYYLLAALDCLDQKGLPC